jgi:hypothetical protein
LERGFATSNASAALIETPRPFSGKYLAIVLSRIAVITADFQPHNTQIILTVIQRALMH